MTRLDIIVLAVIGSALYLIASYLNQAFPDNERVRVAAYEIEADEDALMYYFKRQQALVCNTENRPELCVYDAKKFQNDLTSLIVKFFKGNGCALNSSVQYRRWYRCNKTSVDRENSLLLSFGFDNYPANMLLIQTKKKADPLRIIRALNDFLAIEHAAMILETFGEHKVACHPPTMIANVCNPSAPSGLGGLLRLESSVFYPLERLNF